MSPSTASSPLQAPPQRESTMLASPSAAWPPSAVAYRPRRREGMATTAAAAGVEPIDLDQRRLMQPQHVSFYNSMHSAMQHHYDPMQQQQQQQQSSRVSSEADQLQPGPATTTAGDEVWSRVGQLHHEWPQMLEARQRREAEIEARNTTRSIINAEAYLDAFSFAPSGSTSSAAASAAVPFGTQLDAPSASAPLANPTGDPLPASVSAPAQAPAPLLYHPYIMANTSSGIPLGSASQQQQQQQQQRPFNPTYQQQHLGGNGDWSAVAQLASWSDGRQALNGGVFDDGSISSTTSSHGSLASPPHEAYPAGHPPTDAVAGAPYEGSQPVSNRGWDPSAAAPSTSHPLHSVSYQHNRYERWQPQQPSHEGLLGVRVPPYDHYSSTSSGFASLPQEMTPAPNAHYQSIYSPAPFMSTHYQAQAHPYMGQIDQAPDAVAPAARDYVSATSSVPYYHQDSHGHATRPTTSTSTPTHIYSSTGIVTASVAPSQDASAHPHSPMGAAQGAPASTGGQMGFFFADGSLPRQAEPAIFPNATTTQASSSGSNSSHPTPSSGLDPSIDFAAANDIWLSTARGSSTNAAGASGSTVTTTAKKTRTNLQAIPIKQRNTAGKSDSSVSPDQSGGAASVVLAAPLGRKGGKRLTSEISVSCLSCAKLVARLMCRGKAEDLEVPHKAAFTCLACITASASPESASTAGEVDESSGTTVAAAFSHNGSRRDSVVGKAATNLTPTPVKLSASFRKRHKRDDASLTSCDVCLRDIAHGSVVPDDQKQRIEFQVEVVCAHCDSMYQRCSDCGGGGGLRLGVGKWRSKQLFAEGRRTCSLSHLRLGALSDMFYDVVPIRDIPKDEVSELAEICGRIFANTLLGSMAIPEVIEQKSSIAATYEDVQAMVTRGWQSLKPMLMIDIEPTRNTRRYLSLRSCAPNPRKSSKSTPAEPTRDDRPRVVLRDGKDAVGFILAEWDFLTSSLFLSVVVPWSTGETYDATTILIQHLLKRVERDRLEMNVDRAAQGLPALPGLTRTWTIMFFKRDSRMMNHLEKKRGFKMLEEYLQDEPSAQREWFPPIRPIYLPTDRQEGWAVLVRPHGGGDDFSVRRTAEELKSKLKEKKARARRGELVDDDSD